MPSKYPDWIDPTDPNHAPSTKLTREKREEASPCWDMSQERVFLETVCNQRFNFFLVFFGATIVGAMNSRNPLAQELILGVGVAIGILLGIKLNGTFQRLDLIIDYIRTDPSHPESIITQVVENRKTSRWRLLRGLNSVVDLPGKFAVYQFWIPLACILIQIAFLVGLVCGVIRIADIKADP